MSGLSEPVSETCSLTVRNSGGVGGCSASILVNPVPVPAAVPLSCSLSFGSSSVRSGGSVALRWDIQGDWHDYDFDCTYRYYYFKPFKEVEDDT